MPCGVDGAFGASVLLMSAMTGSHELKHARTHSYYNKILHILPVTSNKKDYTKMYIYLEPFFSSVFLHLTITLLQTEAFRECR